LYNLYGLGNSFKNLLNKRLELTTFSTITSKTFYLNTYTLLHYKNFNKTLNIIFSQINNVNNSLLELKKLNILRTYLVKSYKGYCHSLGKPVRGQRTWSNSWSSFKNNNIMRNFINKVRRLNQLNTNTIKKIDYRSIKKKYSSKVVSKSVSSKKSVFSKNNLLNSKSWY
jgi:ribosomal protein S13